MKQLSATESIRIHKEENKVYYDPEIGFYTIDWYNTGNSLFPTITIVQEKIENE